MKTKKQTWYVYILRCYDGSLYTGIATNIPHRISEHRRKKGSAYVRAHLPVKLIHQEPHKSRSEALRREAEIKSWTRAKKLKLVIPKHKP